MENFRDIKGREIREGDLLREFHFTGFNRKKYYMYKLAFLLDGKYWRAAHIHEIPQKGLGINGSVPLELVAPHAEIIDGYACVGDETSFEDRPCLNS
jgi:hypothetical protein